MVFFLSCALKLELFSVSEVFINDLEIVRFFALAQPRLNREIPFVKKLCQLFCMYCYQEVVMV
jgi:hypothetical protein